MEIEWNWFILKDWFFGKCWKKQLGCACLRWSPSQDAIVTTRMTLQFSLVDSKKNPHFPLLQGGVAHPKNHLQKSPPKVTWKQKQYSEEAWTWWESTCCKVMFIWCLFQGTCCRWGKKISCGWKGQGFFTNEQTDSSPLQWVVFKP